MSNNFISSTFLIDQYYSLYLLQAIFELQTDFINNGTRVLIVDDLLATGGKIRKEEFFIIDTYSATIKYLENKGFLRKMSHIKVVGL